MPRNGSGSYSLPQPPFVPSTTISSSAVNSDLSDIATALTQSISADGQTAISGTLKSSVTATPAYSSTLDATTGFGVSTAGEADVFAGGSKIIAVTSAGAVVNGNLSATGTLTSTGAATFGAATITTATITTDNVTTLNISGILTDSNTGYWLQPRGTTGQRPGGPTTGASRYNTDTNQIEYWNSTTWQTLAGIFAPNFQTFLTGTAATYTTPTAGGNLPLYLRVRMVAGGGGGGAATTNAGGNGTDSSFSNWTAIHGTGGVAGGGGAGGTGGTGGTNGTGTLIHRIAGTNGVTSQGGNIGYGGGTPFSNGPTLTTSALVSANQAGNNAPANSGAGGTGGSNSSNGGGGGAGGEFVEFIISTPAASYLYTVGAFGAGGTAGSQAGGNGGTGKIIVEAFWQ